MDHHLLRIIDEKLDRALTRLSVIEALLMLEGKGIMSAIDDLTAQVAANTDAEKSAATLISALADEIHASAGDTAKVQELAAKLKASGDALAAAVVANTPSAPAPAPVPAPPQDPTANNPPTT